MKLWREREKKSEILGSPAEGGPTEGGPTEGVPAEGGPAEGAGVRRRAVRRGVGHFGQFRLFPVLFVTFG